MNAEIKNAALAEQREWDTISIPQKTNMNDALDYLNMGWHPIPLCWPENGKCACHKKHTDPNDIAKAPLLNSYSTSMKVTEANIRKWWKRWPNANIGILEEVSKLAVVDADSPEAIEETERLGLPVTPMDSTGRGRHAYYSRPEHANVTKKTKKGDSGKIDILCNGYAIVAPSVHASGRSYEWLPGLSPNEVELAEAPAWAVDILNEGPIVNADAAQWSELIDINVDELNIHDTHKDFIINGVERGQRSDAVYSVIRALLEAGYDVNTIASVLLDSDNGISEKPLEKGEAWTSREIGRVMAKHKAEIVEDFDDVPGLGEDGKTAPLKLTTIWEDIDAPEPEWQVEGILPENSLSVVYGEPASCKSFLVQHMALSIAFGRPWMGRKVKQGRVLYIAAEGKGGLGKRWRAWLKHHNVPRSMDCPFYSYGSAVNLGNAGEVKKVIESMSDGVTMVVVDTLNRSMIGADENSAGDTGSFMDGAAMIQRKTGASVVIVHHSGKDKSKGMRGSSAIEGAVDTAVKVERTDDGVIKVKCGKQKDFEEFGAFALHIKPLGDSLVLEPEFDFEELPVVPPAQQKIMTVLEGRTDGLRAKEIQDEADISKASWIKYRKVLLKSGVIKQVGINYFHNPKPGFLE